MKKILIVSKVVLVVVSLTLTIILFLRIKKSNAIYEKDVLGV